MIKALNLLKLLRSFCLICLSEIWNIIIKKLFSHCKITIVNSQHTDSQIQIVILFLPKTQFSIVVFKILIGACKKSNNYQIWYTIVNKYVFKMIVSLKKFRLLKNPSEKLFYYKNHEYLLSKHHLCNVSELGSPNSLPEPNIFPRILSTATRFLNLFSLTHSKFWTNSI